MDSSIHSIAKLFRNGLPDQALAYHLASDPLTKATDATEHTVNTAPLLHSQHCCRYQKHSPIPPLSPFVTSASGRRLAGRFVFQSDRDSDGDDSDLSYDLRLPLWKWCGAVRWAGPCCAVLCQSLLLPQQRV